MKQHNFKSYFAEFLGTFILVFFGCGTAIVTGGEVVPTALAFGLAIVVIAYSVGRISGGHVNPAVSLAMVLDRRLNIAYFVKYCIAQILGALLASGLLTVLDVGEGFGTNTFDSFGGPSTFLFEIIITAFFILVILFVTDNKGTSNVSGLIIGLTLTFVHLIGIPLDGTSVNPARSLGPAFFEALVGRNFIPSQELWVFIFAPLIGAILATRIYWYLEERVDFDYTCKMISERDKIIDREKMFKKEEKKVDEVDTVELKDSMDEKKEEETFKKIEEEFLENTKEDLEDVKETVVEKVDDVKEVFNENSSEMKEDVNNFNNIEDIKKEISEKSEEIREDIVDKVEEIKKETFSKESTSKKTPVPVKRGRKPKNTKS